MTETRLLSRPEVLQMVGITHKITCTVNEALDALSLGRSKFYKMVRDGEIDIVKFGPRGTRVKVASLLRVVEAHSLSANQSATKTRIEANGRARKRTANARKLNEI
jgi:excisionase family DNA binding protein